MICNISWKNPLISKSLAKKKKKKIPSTNKKKNYDSSAPNNRRRDEISEDYLGGRNVMNGHVHQGVEEERRRAICTSV